MYQKFVVIFLDYTPGFTARQVTYFNIFPTHFQYLSLQIESLDITVSVAWYHLGASLNSLGDLDSIYNTRYLDAISSWINT